MKNKISEKILKKGYELCKESRVIKELETGRRIHFKVRGKTEVHSVIFDKQKNKWECDCKWSSLKQKECSHVIAAKLSI